MRPAPTFVLALLVASAAAAHVAAQPPSTLPGGATPRMQYDEWAQRLQRRLLALVDEGVPAELVQQVLVPRLPDRQLVFVPQLLGTSRGPNDSAAQRSQWPKPLVTAVDAAAQELWELARRYAADQPALANRWLHEVVYLNPDHPGAAALVQPMGLDIEPFRIARGRSAWRWPPGVGQGWRSPNYWIETNGDEENARRLLLDLELVHAVWTQLYYDWCRQEGAAVDRLLRPDRRPRPVPRLQAVLFATRDDYTAALGAEVPQIEMTRGYYADQRRMAFFHIEDPGLADVEDMASSWRHEATHQLFDQRRSGRSQLTRQRGTCLIEAIAMHMESLRVHPGYVTVGGVDAPRLQTARHQALIEGRRVPWSQLMAMGQRELQQHENIRSLYAAAAGWGHFWLDHPNPAYRRWFVDVVDGLYSDAQRSAESPTFTGESPTSEDLEQQYLRFLRLDDELLAAVSLAGAARELSLGRTAITDLGLRYLDRLHQLESLDLRDTPVTDRGLEGIAGLQQLRELNLAGTRVTDATIGRLMKLPRLESVQLDGTPATPEARGRLQELLDRRASGR